MTSDLLRERRGGIVTRWYASVGKAPVASEDSSLLVSSRFAFQNLTSPRPLVYGTHGSRKIVLVVMR